MYLDQFRRGDIFKAALEYGSTAVTRVPDTCILTQPAPRTRVRVGSGTGGWSKLSPRDFRHSYFTVVFSLLSSKRCPWQTYFSPPFSVSLSLSRFLPSCFSRQDRWNRPRIVHAILKTFSSTDLACKSVGWELCDVKRFSFRSFVVTTFLEKFNHVGFDERKRSKQSRNLYPACRTSDD